MVIPAQHSAALTEIAVPIIQPVLRALSGYPLTVEEKMHWQRVLRSILHGFVSQECAGYFSHYPADVEESFHVTVVCFLAGLYKEMETHDGN